MNNDIPFDESVKDFLKALDLPSHHPYYVEESHDTKNHEEQYHEGKGHKEWSVLDYFLPHGHASEAEKRPTTDSLSKTFTFSVKDECPEQVTSSFSSDEKTCEDKRYDWLCPNLAALPEELSMAKYILHQIVETFYQVWPSLQASFHLTLRLFAPLILFGAVLYLVVAMQFRHDQTHDFLIASCIALSIILLIMTDECYIQEYGRVMLASIACVVLALVVHYSPTPRVSILLTVPFAILALYMTMYCDIYIPSFKPGLYYSTKNPIVGKIVEQWPVEKRTYRGTPWLVTGDSRTGVPFFLNYIPPQKFVRR